ncbi:hypothetical protein [Dyadobacter sp. BHUBP1]|uniref:hypothetical protein n=1 Tax=Dyadobacter sp. BHUBP1 TaxID=3424178 RepID=UPI003D340383
MLSTSQHPAPPKGGSSTFGLVAIAICVVSFFTIRLFLSMILVGIAIFAIIGLIRDSSKIWSILALCWAGFLIYSESDRASKDFETYSVKYEVTCGKCSVTYTNATGGNENYKDIDHFLKTVSLKGDTYASLSAINDYESFGTVTVNIFVNGNLLKTETSTGQMAVASAYCFPREAAGY